MGRATTTALLYITEVLGLCTCSLKGHSLEWGRRELKAIYFFIIYHQECPNDQRYGLLRDGNTVRALPLFTVPAQGMEFCLLTSGMSNTVHWQDSNSLYSSCH